jgi:cytochrome c oxidase subunit 2
MTPQSVFTGAGTVGRSLAGLGWALNLTAAAVVVIMCAVLTVALFRRRGRDTGVHETGERGARRWVLIGTAITVAILGASFAYTMHVLTAYAGGFDPSGLTVRVTGFRYWWRVQYLHPDGRVDFETANEIHIPAGRRVQLQLVAGDVIHSFWVPALAGKTDLIPGQTNRMWIEADTAGRYVGQCAEYCGTSHANMRIVVYADTPARFAEWEARQRQAAVPPPDADVALFARRGCAACHTIRGTPAAGRAGPDLTHLGGRGTLASGIIPNSNADLSRWLAAPDSIKPGTLMPTTGLTPEELSEMTTYLESLK